MLMAKFKVRKPKKLIAVVAILVLSLLIGIGAYLFYVKSHAEVKPGSKKLTSSQKTVITEGASQDKCKTNMDKVDDVNAKALTPAEAANLYNFQGNCYYENSKFNQAIDSFTKWRDACKAANNPRCVGVAEQQIKAVQNTIKTGER
jgi:hypothetical protein